MGMLRPLAFVVAWAQQRMCVKNPEAATPAIALPKKALLFMSGNWFGVSSTMVGCWRSGRGTSTRFPSERYAGELIAAVGELLIHAFEALSALA